MTYDPYDAVPDKFFGFPVAITNITTLEFMSFKLIPFTIGVSPARYSEILLLAPPRSHSFNTSCMTAFSSSLSSIINCYCSKISGFADGTLPWEIGLLSNLTRLFASSHSLFLCSVMLIQFP